MVNDSVIFICNISNRKRFISYSVKSTFFQNISHIERYDRYIFHMRITVSFSNQRNCNMYHSYLRPLTVNSRICLYIVPDICFLFLKCHGLFIYFLKFIQIAIFPYSFWRCLVPINPILLPQTFIWYNCNRYNTSNLMSNIIHSAAQCQFFFCQKYSVCFRVFYQNS